MNIEPIYLKNNVTDEQAQWEDNTAEGLVRRLLWQIESGQIKPKELVVVYIDYKDSERTYRYENTKHAFEKLVGLFEIGKNLLLRRLV